MFGRRMATSTNSEKLRILSAFDGADVVLGVARGGQVEFIVARRGRLHVDATDRKGVVLSGRRIVLGQIRWIEDATLGRALATVGESVVTEPPGSDSLSQYGDRRWAHRECNARSKSTSGRR